MLMSNSCMCYWVAVFLYDFMALSTEKESCDFCNDLSNILIIIKLVQLTTLTINKYQKVVTSEFFLYSDILNYLYYLI